MNFSPLIEPRELARLLESRACVTLDCRFDLKAPTAGVESFHAGHIPGALYADLNRDLAAPVSASSGRHPLPEPTHFVRTIAAWGISPATHVVVYDERNAAMAARAWWMLRWVGVERAQVLNGGLAAWCAAGQRVETGAPRRPQAAAPWEPRTHAGATVTVDEVQTRLHDASSRLIDARAAARFAGLTEPLDAVAGHVPGAINVPFDANLDAHGRFREAASLRRDWLAILGESHPSQLVSMCGSGVTACHNLLALEVAGLQGAALYPGSWSEWIRDPARPIAKA